MILELLLAVLQERQVLPSPPAYTPHGLLAESLVPGLERVHRLEARYLELAFYLPSGLLNPEPPLNPDAPLHSDPQQHDCEGTAFLLGREPDLFPGFDAFEFGQGKWAEAAGAEGGSPSLQLPIEQLLESGLYEAGYQAAKAVWASHPTLLPEEVLRCFDDAFLGGEPVRPGDQARALDLAAKSQRRLGLLGNGSIAYVAWGFLHLDEFWKDRPGRREEFLAILIDRGVASERSAWAVRRVLQRPLKRSADRPARGIAMDVDALAGPVGFTVRHEAVLERLVSDLEAIRRSTDGKEALAPTLRYTQADGTVVTWENPLAHLPAWSAEMLSWVQRELRPDRFAGELRRGDTLAKRQLYWTELAKRVPFAALREEMLAELRAIVEGADMLPGAERYAELRALAATGELSEADRAELENLVRGRREMHEELIQHMVPLLVRSGKVDHYAQLATTLAKDIAAILSPSFDEFGQDRLLGHSWGVVSMERHPDSLWVLRQHLFEPDQRLPRFAARPMIAWAARHALPGYEVLLEDCLREGSLSDRGAALVRSAWLPAPRYEEELGRLVGDHRSPDLSQWDRAMTLYNILNSLENRNDEAARAIAVRSFHEGRWAESEGRWSWANAHSSVHAWAVAQLSAEDRAVLLEKKLVPPGLLK